MSNDIYLIGEVGYDINLQGVVEAVNATDKDKPINIHIHSQGGYLYEGRAIYNYLKSLDQEVNTYAVGLVASSATIFMLAGKNRYAYAQNNVLIHMPSAVGIGNSTDLKVIAKGLEEEEEKIARIYEQETNFTFDEAMSLMREDRMMTDDEIEKFGLTIKEYKAVAKFDINKNNMSDVKDEKSFWNKLNKLFAKIDEVETKSIVEKSATGQDVNFFERSEGDVITGDKATIDGEEAKGEVLMASGRTYVFNGGKLESVKEAEEEIGEEVSLEDAVTNAVNAAMVSFEAKLKEKDSVIADLQKKIENNTRIYEGLKGIVAENSVSDSEVQEKASDKVETEAKHVLSLS